jgi:hypothetical protein
MNKNSEKASSPLLQLVRPQNGVATENANRLSNAGGQFREIKEDMNLQKEGEKIFLHLKEVLAQ